MQGKTEVDLEQVFHLADHLLSMTNTMTWSSASDQGVMRGDDGPALPRHDGNPMVRRPPGKIDLVDTFSPPPAMTGGRRAPQFQCLCRTTAQGMHGSHVPPGRYIGEQAQADGTCAGEQSDIDLDRPLPPTHVGAAVDQREHLRAPICLASTPT